MSHSCLSLILKIHNQKKNKINHYFQKKIKKQVEKKLCHPGVKLGTIGLQGQHYYQKATQTSHLIFVKRPFRSILSYHVPRPHSQSKRGSGDIQAISWLCAQSAVTLIGYAFIARASCMYHDHTINKCHMTADSAQPRYCSNVPRPDPLPLCGWGLGTKLACMRSRSGMGLEQVHVTLKIVCYIYCVTS